MITNTSAVPPLRTWKILSEAEIPVSNFNLHILVPRPFHSITSSLGITSTSGHFCQGCLSVPCSQGCRHSRFWRCGEERWEDRVRGSLPHKLLHLEGSYWGEGALLAYIQAQINIRHECKKSSHFSWMLRYWKHQEVFSLCMHLIYSGAGMRVLLGLGKGRRGVTVSRCSWRRRGGSAHTVPLPLIWQTLIYTLFYINDFLLK